MPYPADRRVAALAGAGARYKAMSPARLPISREPCLTIPAGFSPSSLLDSPGVLLTNFKVIACRLACTYRPTCYLSPVTAGSANRAASVSLTLRFI